MKLVKSKNIDKYRYHLFAKIRNKYDTATTEGCVLDVQRLCYQDFFVFNRKLPEMENLASKDFTAA